MQGTGEIEDGAMPEGWEPERFGFPKDLETIVSSVNGTVVKYRVQPQEKFDVPRMIIRKKYDPGIDCIPKGWWVWFFNTCWVASTSVGICVEAVRGLEFLAGFIPPEDGQPRQIK